MSNIIEDQENQLLTSIIQKFLLTGETPSAADIVAEYNTQVSNLDLGNPQFVSSNFITTPLANSSATSLNAANQAIFTDLTTLYQSMFSMSDQSMQLFDRWQLEVSKLSAQISALNTRVTNLLIIENDTGNYFNTVGDDFTTVNNVDLADTTCVIDMSQNIVTIGSSTPEATQIFLTNLTSSSVTFVVDSTKNFQSTIQAQGSSLLAPFQNQSNQFWQSQVYMSTTGTVIAELIVQLGTLPINLNSIALQLHASNISSPIQITPLYSTDNYNWTQLPTTDFSLSVQTTATWNFTTISAQYIKFLMSKDGPDTTQGLSYIYEFGADYINFFNQGYEAASANLFYSVPLSALDSAGNLVNFNTVALQTCESLPTGTSIQHYIAVGNDNTVTVPQLEALGAFVAIDPINYTSALNPQAINFASLNNIELGKTTASGLWLQASYNPNGTSGLVNPGSVFTYVDLVDGTTTLTTCVASGVRYNLPTNADKILNYQLATDIPLVLDNVEVLRNLGIQGNKTQVRNVQSGWGFSEPNYSTTAEVVSDNGVSINFGPNALIIDGVSTQGIVTLTKGFHTIQVNKNNWLDVPNSILTVSGLQAADLLYPYNQKLLIEGYLYPELFSGSELYTGVDTFCETLMTQVSIFDVLNSIEDTDYTRYALDTDIAEGIRLSSRVVVFKTDCSNPDFMNERFDLRLPINTSSLLYNYVWLKANLTTTDASVAPILKSYYIKLGAG